MLCCAVKEDPMPSEGSAPRGSQPDSAPKHDLRIDATPEAVARAVLLGGAAPKHAATAEGAEDAVAAKWSPKDQ